MFGRKGILATGRIFSRKGLHEVSNWTKNAAKDVSDTVDRVANKIEHIPGVGILATPLTTAARAATGAVTGVAHNIALGADQLAGVADAGHKIYGAAKHAKKHPSMASGAAVLRSGREGYHTTVATKRKLDKRIRAVRRDIAEAQRHVKEGVHAGPGVMRSARAMGAATLK